MIKSKCYPSIVTCAFFETFENLIFLEREETSTLGTWPSFYSQVEYALEFGKIPVLGANYSSKNRSDKSKRFYGPLKKKNKEIN